MKNSILTMSFEVMKLHFFMSLSVKSACKISNSNFSWMSCDIYGFNWTNTPNKTTIAIINIINNFRALWSTDNSFKRNFCVIIYLGSNFNKTVKCLQISDNSQLGERNSPTSVYVGIPEHFTNCIKRVSWENFALCCAHKSTSHAYRVDSWELFGSVMLLCGR